MSGAGAELVLPVRCQLPVAVPKISQGVLLVEGAALCLGTVVRSHVSKNGLGNILIQPMEILSIPSDCNAFGLAASTQSPVGDVVKKESAIASMVYKKILASASIHMKSGEEVVTESCEGLYRELL